MAKSFSDKFSDVGHRASYNICYLGTAGILVKSAYEIMVEKDLSGIWETIESGGVLYLFAKGIKGRHSEILEADEHFEMLVDEHPDMDMDATIESAYQGSKGRHWYDRFRSKKVVASKGIRKVSEEHCNIVSRAKRKYKKKHGTDIDISAEAEKLDTHSHTDVYRKLKSHIDVSKEIIEEDN